MSNRPVAFALTPALANREVLDFNSPSDTKLFKAATEKLPIEFDCDSENLPLFLAQLRDRAAIYDWLALLLIPKNGNEETTKDLIESYGELTYEDVKRHANTYVNTETRSAQDSVMLYLCIMSSLSEAGQKKVRSRGLTYPFMSGDKGVGTLLLKVVVMVAHVDTRATVTQVRTKLSSLDKTMKDMESDIEKFNDHVLTLANKLQSRGEATQDLLVNLFKGYKACKDAEFVEYIKKKEDFYEEGGDVTHEQLMDWALNKYRARVENEQWCQRTTEEETIIALQAQVKKLLSSAKTDKKKGGKDNRSKDRVNEGKGKNSNRKGGSSNGWKRVAPKEGEPTTKQEGGKEWHWCSNHKAWTKHKESECKGIDFKPSHDDAKKGSKPKNSNSPKMKLANALAAISDEEEDE
jgi:prefoldin subunit 5